MSVNSKKQNKKKKKSKRVFHPGNTVLLFIRFAIACYFLGIYITGKEILDFSGFPEWKGAYVIGGILLLTILLRFFPFPFWFAGRKKHWKSEFVPTPEYRADPHLSAEHYKSLHKLNKGMMFSLIFYFAFTGVFFVLYFLGIIGAAEMFMLTMVYFAGERFFEGVFCPLRAWFMKNKCCTDCRIYNWDCLMVVFPLIVIPGVIPWTLCLVALIYTFIWEISAHIHPERFLEQTNETLRCAKCPKNNCPKRRRELFKNAFSKE